MFISICSFYRGWKALFLKVSSLNSPMKRCVCKDLENGIEAQFAPAAVGIQRLGFGIQCELLLVGLGILFKPPTWMLKAAHLTSSSW